MRTYNTSYIRDMVDHLPIAGFEPLSFILDHDNIVIKNGQDYGVFEFTTFGTYTGHYFFKSRGRAAITSGKQILDELFNEHGACLIIGFTPCEYKAAKWMNRQLGFKAGPIVDTPEGPCQMFTLLKRNIDV